MIRINLIRSKVKGKEQQEAFGDFDVDVGEPAGDQKEMFIRFAIMLIFSILLYGYEVYNIDQFRSEGQRLTRKSTTLKREIQAKKAQVEESKMAQKEFQELEKKIGVLRSLSDQRLIQIKALDYIQGVVPEKLWLTGVKYSSGILEIDGFALTGDDVTALILSLEKRPEFSDVVLLKAKDVPFAKRKTLEFQIRCSLEAKG